MLFLTVLQLGKVKVKAPADPMSREALCLPAASHQAEGTEERSTVFTGQGGHFIRRLVVLERTEIHDLIVKDFQSTRLLTRHHQSTCLLFKSLKLLFKFINMTDMLCT